jgi:hypothetical protein
MIKVYYMHVWNYHDGMLHSVALKQLRPIGKGDQELEKRLVQEELT